MMHEPAAVVEPRVFGPRSRDANPKDWPASFVFIGDNQSQCTATAIGDRVLLTAAHCLGETLHGKIHARSQEIEITCVKHSGYPTPDIWADFALCLTKSPLTAPELGFEVVNTEPKFIAQMTPIKLVGFGCRTPGGLDRGFGKLAEGDAVILRVASNFVEAGGGAAICTGDSGGGAFVSNNAEPSHRRLIAVNSNGDLSDRSYLSITASNMFLDWARLWARANGVQICGLCPGLQHCRNSPG